eukprot:6816671-Prymnesium_polylepis.1
MLVRNGSKRGGGGGGGGGSGFWRRLWPRQWRTIATSLPAAEGRLTTADGRLCRSAGGHAPWLDGRPTSSDDWRVPNVAR